MHFDKLQARCHDCGNVTARTAAISAAVLVLLLAYFGMNTATTRIKGSTACDAVLRGIRRAKAIWQEAGMRYKGKALVGFYQCIAAVPNAFNVMPPVGLESYSRWIDMFELPSDLENMFVPTACLGDYRTRLLIGSLWPVGLVLLFAVGFVGWELLQGCRTMNSSSTRAIGSAVKAGLQRAVPLTLGLTFLVVPSTSMRIFRTFECEPIKYSEGEVRRYLKADLTLSCDSEDYDETSAVAGLFIALWPVGIPLLYAVLLWLSRGAIRNRIPTPLSRATAFLSGDYAVAAFWWEPLEMCRKLALTGWVFVVQDAEQARVLMALLVSIVFLVLHFVVSPLKR